MRRGLWSSHESYVTSSSSQSRSKPEPRHGAVIRARGLGGEPYASPTWTGRGARDSVMVAPLSESDADGSSHRYYPFSIPCASGDVVGLSCLLVVRRGLLLEAREQEVRDEVGQFVRGKQAWSAPEPAVDVGQSAEHAQRRHPEVLRPQFPA